jgi:hypothetical protein
LFLKAGKASMGKMTHNGLLQAKISVFIAAPVSKVQNIDAGRNDANLLKPALSMDFIVRCLSFIFI